MMKIGTTLAVPLLFLLALSGCAHKPTIVGKWQGTMPSPHGIAVVSTIEFAPDGKETVSFQTSGGPISITMGGAYTVSGDSLTSNVTSMTMGAKAVPLPAAQAQPQTSTFTLDGDHLTLNNPTTHQSMTLTRVKE